MVTIEQKLSLFSKLLNQDIKDEESKKFYKLDKEYEKRLAESKFHTDREANDIIEQARKKAELKKVELISRGKMSSKKELMQIKEKLIRQFILHLKEKVSAFTHEPEYRIYLQKLIQDLKGLEGYKNNLIVYVTPFDFEKNQDFIKENLVKIGLSASQISFEVGKETLLGGFIIKDAVLSMQVDESIGTLIEEAKDEIVEKISLVIEEAGDEEDE